MARIELATETLDDFDPILEHLESHDADDPPGRIRAIVDAIQVLETSPYIGRPADGGQRELIVGRRARGYVVLYRYLEELDVVIVLAIRGQREAGYRPR